MACLRHPAICLILLALSGCGGGGADVAQSACAAPDVLLPDLSLSIDGTGFFTVSTGAELRYTRKGDFCADGNGFLINGLGHAVQAYPPRGDGTFDTGTLTAFQLPETEPSGGVLVDATVSEDGVIEAVYTAGSTLVIGKLALASFLSSQNLETEDDVICRETDASGPARRGEAGGAEFGTIQPGLQGPFACEQGRLDMQVVGEGYFRLNNEGTPQYDASIILGVDSLGYYVDDHGYRVEGHAVDADGVLVPALVDLVAATGTMPPAATSAIGLAANLDAGAGLPPVVPFDPHDPASYNFSADATAFDSLGVPHAATFYFARAAVADTWDLHLCLDGVPVAAAGSPFQTLTFSAGVLSSAGSIVYDPVPQSNASADLALTFEATGLTQTGAPFAVSSRDQDGYAAGRATATHIASNGEIRLDYSNGRSGVLLAQLVLAKFPNPAALARAADRETWLETAAAGAPMVDVPGAAGLGEVTATARQ